MQVSLLIQLYILAQHTFLIMQYCVPKSENIYAIVVQNWPNVEIMLEILSHLTSFNPICMIIIRKFMKSDLSQICPLNLSSLWVTNITWRVILFHRLLIFLAFDTFQWLRLHKVKWVFFMLEIICNPFIRVWQSFSFLKMYK